MAGGVNAEINDAWKNPKERELKDRKLNAAPNTTTAKDAWKNPKERELKGYFYVVANVM